MKKDKGLRREEREEGPMAYSSCGVGHIPAPLSSILYPQSSQRGALFGLDARIALAIFSLLAVVAGVSMVTNIASSQAKGLVAELVDSGKAVEAFHMHVKDDIFMVLEEATEARAFQALYDNSVIAEANNWRARWNGPYLNVASNRSASFGDMSLVKRQADHTKPCDLEGNLCFLWLVYSRVKPAVMNEANEILDASGEQSPATTGRLQWSQEADGEQVLYYRVAKALVAVN